LVQEHSVSCSELEDSGRAVAKVEFHFEERFPRVGFTVTNLEIDSRAFQFVRLAAVAEFNGLPCWHGSEVDWESRRRLLFTPVRLLAHARFRLTFMEVRI
jgi:hypothetical protein